MKKRLIMIIVVLVGFLVFWNNYYPIFSMNGTFVSNNTRPIIEGPKSIDTLTVFSDGTFENRPWGKGKYSIEGDQIRFDITNDHGNLIFIANLSRSFFVGSPRIELDSDLGFYYDKMK